MQHRFGRDKKKHRKQWSGSPSELYCIRHCEPLRHLACQREYFAPGIPSLKRGTRMARLKRPGESYLKAVGRVSWMRPHGVGAAFERGLSHRALQGLAPTAPTMPMPSLVQAPGPSAADSAAGIPVLVWRCYGSQYGNRGGPLPL